MLSHEVVRIVFRVTELCWRRRSTSLATFSTQLVASLNRILFFEVFTQLELPLFPCFIDYSTYEICKSAKQWLTINDEISSFHYFGRNLTCAEKGSGLFTFIQNTDKKGQSNSQLFQNYRLLSLDVCNSQESCNVNNNILSHVNTTRTLKRESAKRSINVFTREPILHFWY